MKDLQEIFESMSTKDFTHLVTLIDKKILNDQSVKKIMDYISMAYCGEMNIKEAQVSEDKMDELINSFSMSVALYANILKGHMVIKKGRIKLTDGESCKISLTEEGIKSVENMLKK